MVLQAFIDDSYDEDFYVLGGHLATAENWVRFSKEWEEYLDLATLDKNGKRRFKMKEMMSLSDGLWRIKAFYKIIAKYVDLSISIAIRRSDIDAAKRLVWAANISNFSWDHAEQYGDYWIRNIFALAELHLLHSFQLIRNDGSQQQYNIGMEPIDFYFDAQGEKAIILKAWDGFIDSVPPDVRPLYGASPRFEDDTVFLPLQAADLWAGWIRMKCVKHNSVNVNTVSQLDHDYPPRLHIRPDIDAIARSFFFYG
jgi:Protein of unknown function (DUF3800)